MLVEFERSAIREHACICELEEGGFPNKACQHMWGAFCLKVQGLERGASGNALYSMRMGEPAAGRAAAV